MNTSYTRCFCAICILVVLLSGCGTFSVEENPLASTSPAASTSSAALLTIVSQQTTSPVPSSFVGINLELIDLCSVLRTDAAHQKAYEQLYKNFATGTFHVGGHTADEAIWRPDAKPACLGHPIVTKTLVQSLFAFARRIHWNVIWGLNFLIDNPQMVASEAAYVAAVGGSTLLGFSIGNEPELFVNHGERPAGWKYSNFLTQWEAYRNAVLAQVPTAKFFGPEACCQTSWFSSFLHDAGSGGSLAAATRHYYYYSGSHARATNLTAETLLSEQALQRFTLAAREWVAAADKQGLPVAITEINTISNGGMRGISNTFGAALWTSDILFQSALLGIKQLQFQEVPGAWYASINPKGAPTILYYGLLFFHLAAAQTAPLPSVLNTTENISAYVLKGTDGTLRVVVINKEPHHRIEIAVNPGSSYHTVTTIRMQAASLTATTHVTLGNTTLAANGTWRMPPLAQEPIQAVPTVLSIPANSAALFTFSA